MAVVGDPLQQANSAKPEISETGLKGYLKWLQREQPAVYRKVAPVIAAKQPAAFSDYNQSLAQRMNMRRGRLSLRGLGDDSDDTGITSITFDPNDLSLTSQASNAIDVSDAANSGTGSSSLTSWLTALVGGASQLYLTKSQLDTAQQVTNLQLQRAQAGLPPLNIDMTKMGVPSVAVGLSSSTQSLVTYALIGGGLLFLVMSMGGRKSRR